MLPIPPASGRRSKWQYRILRGLGYYYQQLPGTGQIIELEPWEARFTNISIYMPPSVKCCLVVSYVCEQCHFPTLMSLNIHPQPCSALHPVMEMSRAAKVDMLPNWVSLIYCPPDSWHDRRSMSRTVTQLSRRDATSPTQTIKFAISCTKFPIAYL